MAGGGRGDVHALLPSVGAGGADAGAKDAPGAQGDRGAKQPATADAAHDDGKDVADAGAAKGAPTAGSKDAAQGGAPDSSSASPFGVPGPQQRWQAAGERVRADVGFSQAFASLRDMSVGTVAPGQLEVIKVLGQGAFATVEQAWFTPEGGGQRYMVAVKRLKAELFANQEDLDLFAQEVELMRKLRHRNIVDFVAAGEICKASPPFVVQEFMAGGTLKQLVTRQMLSQSRVVYSNQQALDICLQMARGLRYLHRVRPMVIHRDLKLENVLLASSTPGKGEAYEVKIADFGLSRRVAVTQQAIALLRRHSSASRSLASRTSGPVAASKASSKKGSTCIDELEGQWSNRVEKSFIGSRPPSVISLAAAFSSDGALPTIPAVTEVQHKGSLAFMLTGRTGSLMYMAPEVFREEPYSEKADVFSFGVMMYEVMHKYIMLSAVAVAGTYEELEQYCSRVAAGFRPPVHKNWPASVTRVIQDCWAQEPAARPSMEDVVTRLEAIQAGGDLDAMPAASACSCTIC